MRRGAVPLALYESRKFQSPRPSKASDREPGDVPGKIARTYPLIDPRRRRALCSSDAEPIPGGYYVIDANGLALAHVYGQPPVAVAFSDKRLTNDEAEKLARLIVGLPAH
jgi:hypothetical protein